MLSCIWQARLRWRGVVGRSFIFVTVALFCFNGMRATYREYREVRGGFMAWRRIGEDDITLSERRFEHLRAELPTHGLVGFQVRPRFVMEDENTARYFHAQYALVPLILCPDGHLDINIFDTPSGVVIARNKNE